MALQLPELVYDDGRHHDHSIYCPHIKETLWGFALVPGGGAKVSAREMSDGDEPCSLFGGPQRVAVSDSKRWTRDADEFLNTLNEAMINRKTMEHNCRLHMG